MDKQELREALDRALAMNHNYFRSFGPWDWLGLSGFSDEELADLNRCWLDYQGDGQFEPWLKTQDTSAHQRYMQQLDTVWKALRSFTNIADNLSISGLQHARQQLNY